MRHPDRLRIFVWLWMILTTLPLAHASEVDSVYAYVDVEVKPQFPGGDEAMYRWLGENIAVPPTTEDLVGSYRVVAQFEIDKDGKVVNVEIYRTCKTPLLDRAVLEILQSMPDWTPGYVNGQPVRVNYKLPITFKMLEYTSQD